MGPNQTQAQITNWVHLGNWPTPVERPPWIFLVYRKSPLWSISHRCGNSKIPKCPCHFFRLEYQMWTKVYHSFLFILLLLFPHLWFCYVLFADFWCRATPPDKDITRKEGPCLVPCQAIAKRLCIANNQA
jgi:hypothetical protein